MILPQALLLTLDKLLTPLSRKTTLPALDHVFFIPAGAHTIIASSDLDLYLYWPVRAETPAWFSCPRAWLLRLVRANRKGQIELRLEADKRHVIALPSHTPSSRSPDTVFPFTDLPEFSTAGFEPLGHLSAHTLRAAAASIPFVSTDETRYTIGGVAIQQDGTVVATDGRAMAYTATRATSLGADLICPPKLITLLDGALGEADPNLTLPLWKKHDAILTTLACGAMVLARVIDGNFPNWRQVVPNEKNITNIVTLADDFAATLAHYNKAAKEVRVRFSLQPDRTVRAICYTSKQDLGDPFLAGTHLGTNTFAIAANAAFLLKCVQFAGPKLRLQDGASPFVNGEPGQRQAILMPFKLEPHQRQTAETEAGAS